MKMPVCINDIKVFPTYQLYFEEDTKTYHLEFDGLDGVPSPSRVVLTDTGAEAIKSALFNMPVYITNGRFWGYKNQPLDDALWNCEAPEEDDVLVQLSSQDKSALLTIANHLSNLRCWKVSFSSKKN